MELSNKLANEVEKFLIYENNKTNLTLALNSYRMGQLSEHETLKLIDEEFKPIKKLELLTVSNDNNKKES